MNATGNKSELSNRIHRLFLTSPSHPKKKINLNAYLFGILMMIVIGSYAFSNFSYPTVSIAVNKMNVLYIGLDNPITVAVAGVPTEKTKVESDDLILKDQGNGHFNVEASEPGIATIRVSAKGHATQEIEFRVKRVPDPVAKIGRSSGGAVSKETFWEFEGLDAVLDNFAYDASCVILKYHMTRVGKNEDPVESINRASKPNDNTTRLLKAAKAGDIYYFDNVTCMCPGYPEERKINSLVFKIR